MIGDCSAVVSGGESAYWAETGRPLTEWERRMRSKRCDVWVPIAGSVYRLALGYQQIRELETVTGEGIGRLEASLADPNSPQGSARAPAAHYAHALRLALTGGAVGVRGGKPFTVSPLMAAEMVDRILAGPLSAMAGIVRAGLAACIHGRDATPEEVASFSIPAGPPVVPAWALEYCA
jgi:hypothetical protein